MYAQLGNIRFEGLKGFQSFKQSHVARYAELQLINGKSRLQKTGDELITISFDLRLHTQFTDPAADFDTLKTYASSGEILTLSDGTGEIIGTFVIRSISAVTTINGLQGEIICLELQIELSEHVDPNPAATAATKAKADAFAVDPEKVIPIRLVRVGTTLPAVVSLTAKSSTLYGLQAVDDTNAALSNPAEKDSLFRKAQKKLESGSMQAADVIEKIQESASIAAKAPLLLAAMQDIADNMELLTTRLIQGDLTNALTQATALNSSLAAFPAAILPLNISLITRRPI